MQQHDKHALQTLHSELTICHCMARLLVNAWGWSHAFYKSMMP